MGIRCGENREGGEIKWKSVGGHLLDEMETWNGGGPSKSLGVTSAETPGSRGYGA